MKAHRSLQPEDLLCHGPRQVALMVASEFGRASSGCDYRSDVIACYQRARELMGVLETIPMDERAAAYLKPFYQRCIEPELLREDRLAPEYVKEFGACLADAFESAARMMTEGPSHA